MVRVDVDPTYTSSQYRTRMANNNFRITSDNNNNNYLESFTNIDKDVWTHGISPHHKTQYTNRPLSILYNIINTNQNSLSTLSVNYIGYFYRIYPNLIKNFPNLFPQFYKTYIDNLKKYINCSLIKLKCYITYFTSCMSPSLTSDLSNINCLVHLIFDLPPLIRDVSPNICSSIALNLLNVNLKACIISKSLNCCNDSICETIKLIPCIKPHLSRDIYFCRPNLTDFETCLNEIKTKICKLKTEIECISSPLNEIKCSILKQCISFDDNISKLKSQICCLITNNECIKGKVINMECKVKESKKTIDELKELKDYFNNLIKCSEWFKCIVYCGCQEIIVLQYFEHVKSQIEKLLCHIDVITNNFNIIDTNTTGLKHSLMFNDMYFKISVYILDQIDCIYSCLKSILPKVFEIRRSENYISNISNNIKEVKSVIDKINYRWDDLGYIRDSLCSIIPKLSKIKDPATKIKGLECIVDPLKKVRNSIENLKNVECEQKCIEIFDFNDTKTLKYTLICIEDKLNIKSITNKLDTIRKSLCIFECMIPISKKLEPCMESLVDKINYVVQWVDEVKRCLDNIIKRFIKCSLQSLSNHIMDKKSSDMVVPHMNIVIINLMSRIVIDESMFVLSKIYVYYKTKNLIDETLKILEFCLCLQNFNKKFKIGLKDIQLLDAANINDNPHLKLHLKNKTHNEENKLCLCLVVRYILLNDLYLLIRYHQYLHRDVLSCMSRSCQKYSYSIGHNFNVSTLIMLIITSLDKITLWMRKRFTGYKNCYCDNNQDPYYPYLISIILFVSSLVENIWIMDPETVSMAIDKISSLLSEYQSLHVYTNYYSPSRYNIIRNMISSLSHGKSIEGTISHSATGVGVKDKESFVKSTITSTITESKEKSRTTTSVISTIKRGAAGVLNHSTKSCFMALKTMILGTHFSKESFALIYNKFSSLSFYTQSCNFSTNSTVQIIRNPGMEISIKFLNSICNEETCRQSCCKTNGVCKICPTLKIRINCLDISLKKTELVLSNVSADMLLNYLIGSINITVDFIANLCVGFGEVYTIMLKNIQLTSSANVSNNITDVTTVRNWGYDTRYEQDLSASISLGDA